MSRAKIAVINIKSVDSLNKLLYELSNLDGQLLESDLHRLATFNSAYLIVTTEIKEKVDDGGFENPKFIERFTIEFSRYYFQVVNDAIADVSSTSIAWTQLLRKKTNRQLPNFINLLLGANAHINHDLPLVMVKMLDGEDSANFIQDLMKVDTILKNSGNEILGSFIEAKKVPKFIKDRLSFIYLPVVMQMILFWRAKAWEDYRVVKENGISSDRAKKKGKAIGNQLVWLGKMINY